MRYILIVIMSVSILLTGCSEKPERQAAKDIRKSAEKARDIISEGKNDARHIMRQSNGSASDKPGEGTQVTVSTPQEEFAKAQTIIRKSFEEARGEIENSLQKNNRKAGKLSTPAIIASGNIIFSQAFHLQSTLAALAAPIDSLTDDISKKVIAIVDLSTSKALREKLITANDNELQQLKDILDRGTDSYPGLKEQLKNEETKLALLEKKLQELESIANTANKTANSIEKAATEKLRTAEGLSGEKKLELQNEAFDLRLSKKQHSMTLQATNDRISILNSRVSIITPIINKLVGDISSINKAIEGIINTNSNATLSSNISAIENKSDEHKNTIRQNLSKINSTLSAYRDSLNEVTALLDQAMEQYKKVSDSSGRQIAQSRVADCLLRKAAIYSEGMRQQNNLLFRIKSITALADSQTAADIAGTTNNVSTAAAEHGAKSLENYDLAITEYENISGSGKFGCAVKKCQILALYGKITFAEYLGMTAVGEAERDKNYAIADAAAEKTKELIKQAIECDPAFARSVTNRMLDGEIDYTPRLRVDMEGHYKEVSKQFLSWSKLKGEDRKAEVERLIELLLSMEPAEDQEAFDRILTPEREKLNAAMKRGFEDNFEDDEDFDLDSGGADTSY